MLHPQHQRSQLCQDRVVVDSQQHLPGSHPALETSLEALQGSLEDTIYGGKISRVSKIGEVQSGRLPLLTITQVLQHKVQEIRKPGGGWDGG